jgi:protein-S-isoprenylcysteine O-methyltransferase Ste14
VKGREALAAHLPWLRAAGGFWVGALILGSFGAALAALLAVDQRLPAWSGPAQAVAGAVGFVWAAQFYWRRGEYRARWGAQAYRHAFTRHMLTGAPVMFAAIAHTGWLPGERALGGWASLAVQAAGLYFALTGALLYLRSYQVFGVDNVAALYVYVPAGSRLVTSSIYAVLRHPAYGGLARVGLGLGLWNSAWLGLALGLLTPLGLAAWLRWVEEPELLERFGAGYAAYRRQAPALWPRFGGEGRLLRFLIGLPA